MHEIMAAPNMIPSIITMLLVLIGLVPAWAAWQKTRWMGRQQVDAAEQAAAIADAQRKQAEDQAVTAGILAKLAEDQAAAKLAQERIAAATAQLALDTAASKLVQERIAEDTKKNTEGQAVIGARVDGQMSALHLVIEDLRSIVVAKDVLIATEKDKAAELAIQAVKDRAEADAKLVAASQGPAGPPVVVANGGGTQVVQIPAVTVPVEEAAPPEEPKRIVQP